MADVAGFRAAVALHVPNGADTGADVAATQQLIAKEANSVNIPEGLARNALDIASEGTSSQMARIAAVLQAVEMHASDMPAHQDPMKLAKLETPAVQQDNTKSFALSA